MSGSTPTTSPLLVGVNRPRPDLPEAWLVVDRSVETDDVVTLRVRPIRGTPPAFAAAQFSMIGVAGVGEVPISISMASEDEGWHGYTIRRAGAVTARLVGVAPGDHVTVRGPFGRPWDLSSLGGRHVVFVAGGIGIAPLRVAITRTVALAPRPASVHVLAGSRHPSEVVYSSWFSELRRAGVDVQLTVDRVDGLPDGPPWNDGVGLVTEVLAQLLRDLPPSRVAAMVCGPDVMMGATMDVLGAARVPSQSIQLTLERNMHCGIGWCGHCQLGPLLVCRDGPVVTGERLGDLLTIGEL